MPSAPASPPPKPSERPLSPAYEGSRFRSGTFKVSIQEVN